MTPQEREKTAADLAGILARGYDQHIAAHGPDGSCAVRTADGSRYTVQQATTGAVSFVERDGETFAIHVTPLAGTAGTAGTAYDPIPKLAWLLGAAQRLAEGIDASRGVTTFARQLSEALHLPELATAEEAEAAIRKALAEVASADVSGTAHQG